MGGVFCRIYKNGLLKFVDCNFLIGSVFCPIYKIGLLKFVEYYIFELGVFFVLYIKMELKNLLIINF